MKRTVLYCLLSLGIFSHPEYLFAANWNDPGVNPVQSISDHRWRDANTGQYISTNGAPGTTATTPATTPQTAPKAPYVAPTATQYVAQTATPQPSTPQPATPNGTNGGGGAGGGTAGNNTAAGNNGGNAGTGNNTANTATKTGGKLAKGAGAVAGTALGGYMIYESVAGKEKHTVGDVVTGTMGGLSAGAAIGSVFGGVGIGTAIGAVAGGLVAGSQLFSETDCLNDPVTGDFTCCHTVFNKGKRYADIGDFMFCGDENGQNYKIGSVRQCQQGGQGTKHSWWEGLWKDDAWAGDCVTGWCSGEVPPESGYDAYVEGKPDTELFCWRWDCKEGFTRSGNKCVNAATGESAMTFDNQYDAIIQKAKELKKQLASQCGNM